MTEQRTAKWLENRRKHIGASDISCITGNNPWKSAYILWLEKTGRKEPDTINAAMQHGIDNEEAARQSYMSIAGENIMPNILIFDKWEIAMASVDGITQDNTVICEIKCPFTVKLYNNAKKEIIPNYYLDQMQWQLMVSGAERCDFFVYLNDLESICLHVYPIKDYQDKLLLMAVEFWDKVVSDKPPEKHEDDYEVIESAMPNELLQHWRVWKQQNEEATYNMKLIEEQIKEMFKNKKCHFNSAQVKLNWVSRKGVVNWKKVCSKWDITDNDIEEFRNNSIKYPKLTIVE